VLGEVEERRRGWQGKDAAQQGDAGSGSSPLARLGVCAPGARGCLARCAFVVAVGAQCCALCAVFGIVWLLCCDTQWRLRVVQPAWATPWYVLWA
jgi:hypothetical protein